MDCQVEIGQVRGIVTSTEEIQEIEVEINGQAEKAINFPKLTGTCEIGNSVVLNTTAVRLNLGTGGHHFVMAVLGKNRPLEGQGHIMKLRYTPSQGRVLSVEEPDSPHHQIMRQAQGLDDMPVIVGSLHSMLGPVALGFAHRAPGKRLVYVMSDGAALPLKHSRLVKALQEQQLLAATITFGHAFGGDYEAVNIFSALLAARHVCQADAVVVLMGPGVVGTNTPWGTTALEQGVYLNAAHTLKGRPIGIVRMSSADQRERHQGISHHSLTALGKVASCRCLLPIPAHVTGKESIKAQLQLLEKHELRFVETAELFHLLENTDIHLSSMGRRPSEDPDAFAPALAAGFVAAELVNPVSTHLE